MRLTDLTNESLLASLDAACLEGHGVTARIVACLLEVEERRLHLEAACSSMFDFCVRKLKMSEGAAFRRINAARLVRRFPSLLDRIGCGEVCLSTLVLLRPHLTETNVDELLAAVRGKTQREIEVVLARRAPKPDVRASISLLPSATEAPSLPVLGASDEAPVAMPARPVPSRIGPLSEARFKVQLTAGAELKAKLERAQDLMRHRNPSGDLAVVLEAAVDLLLARLERERLAKTSRPRRQTPAKQKRSASDVSPEASSETSSDGSPHRTPRALPRSVRREVFARDGERCTFESESGERCPARGFLEIDHVESKAIGGSNAATNLRVLCRAHNELHAEQVFGRRYVAERIDFRQRKGAARRKGGGDAPVFEQVARGLTELGFGKAEAQRALRVVAQHHGDGLARVGPEVLVREALRVLT